MKKETPTNKPRRPSPWLRPMWWINVVAVVVLLVTYLAPHISPRYFWPLALLAFTYPYQLLVHLGLMGWWAFFRPKRVLLSGAALLLGWGHIGDHVQLFGRGSPSTAVQGEGLKVLSYNVRVFDLYNWTHNAHTRDAIFDLFHREDADILCLQEFFHSPNKRFFRTKDDLMRNFRYTHVHEHYPQHGRFDSHFGVATFSTRPIVARGVIAFPENPNNQCIWSDIAVDGDTIRVYNAHLASYHFGNDDYAFLGSLDTDTPGDTLKRGGLRILKRLRAGVMRRVGEVDRIVEHMTTSPHPVVYCGDMNDVPMSRAYGQFRELLTDAFTESGRGLGGTYIGKLPSLRIDHILHNEELETWDFRTLPDELSDHRPVSCNLAVRAR
ncbi:MAG: endonuclease/exonuclease/phosphatase family protein [Flavobacteriales bacterium]|jgi:endonuclease/exonuclease/phosphatase family metal-dependent hydrolase